MTDGFVYFAQEGDDGPIKVGFSEDPGKRVAALQGAHYEPLHLIGLTPGTRWDEAKIHEKLERFALGREWYVAAPEVLAEIQEPVARVHEALESAVVAREHLQRAIALLRGADGVRAREELARVAGLIDEALASVDVVA
jgi:hypothetical protein